MKKVFTLLLAFSLGYFFVFFIYFLIFEGFLGQGRFRGKYSNSRESRKRPHSDGRKVLLADDYSLESLMSAEFPEICSIDELAEEISKALGEVDGSTIMRLVLT